VGRLSVFNLSGSGDGDVALHSQYQISRSGARTRVHLLLDASLPTAESSPKNAFDLPIGRGNYAVEPGVQLSREVTRSRTSSG